MNNGTIEASFEQAKQAPKVVNADEVTSATLEIPVFCYEDTPLFLDNGKPFLDKDGNQRMGRVSIGTRTAKIKVIAPINVYTKAMTVFSGLETNSLNNLDEKQLNSVADLVLECWQISEPFMTKDDLKAGIDGLRLMEVFTRFFFQESQPQNTSPSQEGGTTKKRKG